MRFMPYFYFRFGRRRQLGVVYRRFCNFLHQISRLLTTRVTFDIKQRSPTLFPVLRKPDVVTNDQTAAGRSIYCIKVEHEVGYCEFVYAVSDIFLLPVSAYALVGRLLSPFCNLLRQISHLSTVTGACDAKQLSLTLFPVLPKPQVVLTAKQWKTVHILY